MLHILEHDININLKRYNKHKDDKLELNWSINQ